MEKRIINGLKLLLTAARLTLYTKRARPAKPKFSFEPISGPIGPDRVIGSDDWLFDADAGLTRETNALSKQMNTLSDHMSGLRETLALISGETAFPVHALTERPCAMLHHDPDLFDGEAEPRPPHQDNTIGGEGAFLFGDEPAFDEMIDQRAA